jgi:CRISPR-associated protein Csm1
MDNFDQKEYQTVILAALLHDVGKLLHRGTEKSIYKGKHEKASAEFINSFSKELSNDNLYDINLVRILVRCHDIDIKRDDALNDPYLEGQSEEYKERVWKMIRIVRIADSYSCSEREKGDFARQRTLPLESVFSYASLDEPQRHFGRYRLNTFKPMSGFPEQIKELTNAEINDLITQFEKSIKDISLFTSFDNVLVTWLNILHEYMWAVPSDTRYKYDISDISLFDHLRGTAAIAACLYKQHRRSLDEDKDFNRKNEFILIAGDFSGIQDYIFDITNRGAGGASKRLRARSFFIYIFSEVTIHKILHALRLPIVCNIFSAGGKFLMFAPNVDGLQEELTIVKSQIEKEIHETYFSQFAFLMSWKMIEGFREELKVHNFFRTAADMFYALEREKVSKSQTTFIEDDKWVTNAFKASILYEAYKGNEDCQICGKGTATYEEGIDEEGRVVKSCFVCYRDKLFIGQKIPKCKYIAFAKGTVSKSEEDQGAKIVLFHDNNNEEKNNECYYVELLDKHSYNPDCYLIYNVGEEDEQIASIDKMVPFRKYHANYVLLDAKGNVESFENIAKKSRWKKNDLSYGSDLLGILKADVDNLGLIFNKGFEIPSSAEEGLPDIDRKTVSRFLTLSRMLELFFSGWMKETMSGNNKDIIIEKLIASKEIDKDKFKDYLKGDHIDFQNIYTVYSGGDDLVLVGPWETMIVFSIFLNQQFREYTCNNKFITLSAGLAFVKPKYPIASAIKQADELLKKSKKEGKNRITLFGTTIEWKKLSELIDYFLFLNKKYTDEDSKKINSSFLYRLLKYHQMALEFLDNNRVDGLKFISALNYDIGRNIVEWNKEGKIVSGEDEYDFLQCLINERPHKSSLMYNLKIPLFWTLYRNRKATISKEDQG